jgi:hypothetical protein
MLYRRPIGHVPPYSYCDRDCASCAIDKDRCLLYQRESDERLHREIDAAPRPEPQEVSARAVREGRRLLEQVRRLGLDSDEEPASAASPKVEEDPLATRGSEYSRALAALLRERASDLVPAAPALRRLMTLVGPKLHRAATPGRDEAERADAILQAQAAHRALVRVRELLVSLGASRRGLTDAALDLLAEGRRLESEIESRWLSQPNSLLEAVGDGPWWGPLREIPAPLRLYPA